MGWDCNGECNCMSCKKSDSAWYEAMADFHGWPKRPKMGDGIKTRFIEEAKKLGIRWPSKEYDEYYEWREKRSNEFLRLIIEWAEKYRKLPNGIETEKILDDLLKRQTYKSNYGQGRQGDNSQVDHKSGQQ